ncbi:hypothetical protein [Marinimicrobium sp. ABcell2]|uniref:hypothetical protein n=1 Tax=Marinimicrobium sp. ABcell2 TaxID=3069751 RepID=UPI0027AFCA5C|nr:hypothetical protein [Marinimicrobium sp. ABcell2]MDQ2077754.1 hypothetical protein [Marinimicrobium sp. ABcell2]
MSSVINRMKQTNSLMWSVIILVPVALVAWALIAASMAESLVEASTVRLITPTEEQLLEIDPHIVAEILVSTIDQYEAMNQAWEKSIWIHKFWIIVLSGLVFLLSVVMVILAKLRFK